MPRLYKLTAVALCLGGLVLDGVPHDVGEAEEALVALGELHPVRRLNLKEIVAHAHVVFSIVGEENSLLDYALVSGLGIDVYLVGSCCHGHFPVRARRNLNRQNLLHVPLGVCLAVFDNDVRKGGLAEELVDKAGVGLIVKLGGRADLDYLTHIHDQHSFGQRHSLGLIVRDEDYGKAELPLELLYLKSHALAQFRVKVGKRLVKKHYLGVGDYRTRKRNTLLLTAGEVAGIFLLHAVKAAMLERFHDALVYLGSGNLSHAQRESDVFKDVHMRPHRKRLENHTQIALFGRNIDILFLDGDLLSAQLYLTGGQIFKSGYHSERCRLAAAGRAEEREALAFLDGKIEIIDGGNCTQQLCCKILADISQYYLIHNYAFFLSLRTALTMVLSTMMSTIAMAARAEAVVI